MKDEETHLIDRLQCCMSRLRQRGGGAPRTALNNYVGPEPRAHIEIQEMVIL